MNRLLSLSLLSCDEFWKTQLFTVFCKRFALVPIEERPRISNSVNKCKGQAVHSDPVFLALWFLNLESVVPNRGFITCSVTMSLLVLLVCIFFSI